MVQHDKFINKLRELGYNYKRETEKVSVYKKRGGSHRVMVPSKKLLDDAYVRSTLRQCGARNAEIETFIGTCNN